MSTATQTAKRTKSQLPPDMAVVDSTAQRAKAMREAQKATAQKTQMAIELMLGTVSRRLEWLRKAFSEEHENGEDVRDVLGLAEICQAEMARAIHKKLSNYGDFVDHVANVGSLVRAVGAVYGDRDDYCSRLITSTDELLDAAFEVVEAVENGEVWS